MSLCKILEAFGTMLSSRFHVTGTSLASDMTRPKQRIFFKNNFSFGKVLSRQCKAIESKNKQSDDNFGKHNFEIFCICIS